MENSIHKYYRVHLGSNEMSFTLPNILLAVSKVTEFHIDAIISKSRKRELVELRAAFFIISDEYTDKIDYAISKVVNRDRTTFRYAINNLNHLKEVIAIKHKAMSYLRSPKTKA